MAKLVRQSNEGLPTFADFRMRDVQVRILVEHLLAVAAVSTDGVVLALHADAAGLAARQEVEFLVETTLPRMIVAIAG